MSIQILHCQQNTPEWYAARLGIPTASEFHNIVAEPRKGESISKTRRKYMMRLIGEQMTREKAYTYTNAHMERGHAQEDDARTLYEFAKGIEVERVGFIRNEWGERPYIAGCSPDSLVGKDGLLEIKSKLADIQAEVLLAKAVPAEHRTQIQGQLWLAEREWCDFVSYCPKMPPFIKRVYRDEVFIKGLSRAVEVFINELHTLLVAIQEAA